jgi:arylsulfatase A-like enzyme
MERRIDDGYEVFHWSHHPMPGWGNNNEYWDWLDKKGVRFETPKREDSDWVKTGMPEAHHQTTWCVEKAIDFIEKRSEDDQPWLFSINIFDPHHPFDPPIEYLQPYLDRIDEIPLPNYVPGELDNKPPYQKADNQKTYGPEEGKPYDQMTDYDHRLVRASYWAMCDLIDAQIGRLMDSLNKSGMREDTIVIFMSDHGEMLGDHGIYMKGPYFYEEAVHVPLIINCPAKIQSGVIAGLTELTDIAPTILDACGVEQHRGMQGVSMWRKLSGEPGATYEREDVYSEYMNAMPWPDEGNKPFLTMVQEERFKIVVDHEGELGELYDMEKDPTETMNLWDSHEHVVIKAHMLERVCNRLARTVDPLPERLAVW